MNNNSDQHGGSNPLFPGHPAWFTGYNNVVCLRAACGASKPTGTGSTYCAACDALPFCEYCGEPLVDCDENHRADDARGREDDYGCAGAYFRNGDADRESWVECQWADRMEDDYR